MKTISKILALSAIGGLMGASAQTTQTEVTETEATADGRVTETTTTTTTFTPEVETKVVKYFDEYKEQKFGLPPGVIEKVQVSQIPRTWVSTRVAPGLVIAEEERKFLAPAPAGLIKVLPKLQTTTHSYHMMGGNVVVVDTETYRVVDSVRIPSVRIVAE